MANSNRDRGREPLTPFVQRTMIVAAAALLTVLAACFLWFVRDGVLLGFAAVLFAVMLDGVASWLRRMTRWPRGWALSATVLGLLVILAGSLLFGGARVANQMPQLGDTLQQSIGRVETGLQQVGLHPEIWFGSTAEPLPLAERVFGHIQAFVTVPIGIATDLLIVVVIGIYLAVDPQTYLHSLARLLPASRRARAMDVAGEIAHALRRWLIGRFCAMALVAALITAGLFGLGVKLALMLGFIAGLLTFVPYLGAVVSAIPALFVALMSGPLTVLYVALLFLLAHLLEGYLLIPWIQKRAVSMAPAFLIMAQLLGGLAAGAFGVLLATPVAVTATIVIQMLYLRDVLNEPVHILGEPGDE